MKTWLLLDCPYLVCRGFYASPELEFQGARTGGIFGFLREVITLRELFATDRFVFCFDLGVPARRKLYPQYKLNRIHSSEEKRQAGGEIKKQLERLRTEFLPELGCKNIFAVESLEADDVIASVCQNLPVGPCSNCNGMGVAEDDFTGSKKADCRCCNGTGGNYDSAVIVSSDKDLWQLLSPTVSMWNPRTKKMTTEKSFIEEWKLNPADWPYVKAVAGCDGDNVAGIKGVGEKTAAKYWRLELGEKSKALRAIETDEGLALADDNFKLVKLPFPGTPVFQLREDNVNRKDWDKLVERLGMRSLVGKG